MTHSHTEPGPTIDYRTPGIGRHRVQVVAQVLARGQAMDTAAACGKLALGLMLTLVGPLLATGIVFVVATRPWRSSMPPFAITFGLACIIVVPLLLWYERRTHGRFLDDAIAGETSPLQASSYGEYELQKSKLMWTAYVEAALLGPRLLWHLYDWARDTPNVHQPSRVLAAEVIVELLDAGEGLPIKRLLHIARSPAEVGRAIRYLQSRDWVDLSRGRDRVWLTSVSRAHLEKALRGPPHADRTFRQ